MTIKTFALIGACTSALLLANVSLGRAAPMTIGADLKAEAETPPNTSKGTGTLAGTYDPATKTLAYSVSYANLTGPATAAHFHAPALIGKAAGVEIPINGSLGSPIKGQVTLTDAQAANLTTGMTYFNIHTAANKAGEIRGQVAVAK